MPNSQVRARTQSTITGGLGILAEKIHDQRFLRLVRNMLRAGYLEDWEYHETLSGCPQGGVVSPVLSNIYLHKLDEYVERELIPQYTRTGVRLGVWRPVACWFSAG